MSIRWINEFIGTAPATFEHFKPGDAILDVRDLVDKGGNNPEQVRQKIAEGVAIIGEGKRLVVCCDYGISRSNAIAAGILAKLQGISVDQAARIIIDTTGEKEIKIELLGAARAALESSPRDIGGKKRILLTGGNGFLGTAVAEQLRQMSIDVIAPSRLELDLMSGRAELDMLVRGEGITGIVHLANPRVFTSNIALGETLTMLRNVLEICALNDTWLLYPSNWEVYSGYSATLLRADEALPLHASGPYGETKLLCETLIEQFRRTQRVEVALVRSSLVYGPGSERPRFISTFIEKASRGEPIITHKYMNGEPALDLLHVDDLAKGFAKAVSVRFVGNLNIGSGRTLTTRQIAKTIVQSLNSQSTIDSILIKRNVANIMMDNADAQKKIDWQPEIPAEAGLKAVVEQVGKIDLTEVDNVNE